MKLFENYLNEISQIIKEPDISGNSFLGLESKTKSFAKSEPHNAFTLNNSSNNNALVEFDKEQLNHLFGVNKYSFPYATIGDHPDFSTLQYNDHEYHYCVSMFMDIKGSTRFNEIYSLPKIRKIKDAVLTLAIHIASHFGGHVHRLQGDGIFIQFVRKSQKEQDAVINALNAASVFSHFLSTSLADRLITDGAKPLSVRTGIDLGFESDVLWSYYGIPNCSELTTTSLHTDLASKLQSQAGSNGIYVGGNVQQILDIKPEFCADCRTKENKADYYIYKGKINYRKFEFNWKNYLQSFDFIYIQNGVLVIDEPNIKIECKTTKPGSTLPEVYFQNSASIEKESKIEYQIIENGHNYIKKDWETIEWKAINSGNEARELNALEHDFGNSFKNKTYCNTDAMYVGHHYVQCKIIRQHSNNIKMTFPIYVK